MAATDTATKTTAASKAANNAPPASTPAPAAETSAPAAGPLSFSDVQDGQMFGRAGSGSGSQFTDILQTSYKERNDSPGFGVKRFTVPEAQRDTMIQAVRSEAGRLNLGVKIRHNTADGQTEIRFQAGDKRQTSKS